jgi:preprotein translocase subunit SecG
LTKTTTILATLFFVISIFLGSITANSVKQEDEWTDLAAPVQATSTEQAAPATDLPVENKDSDLPVEDDNKSSDVPVN